MGKKGRKKAQQGFLTPQPTAGISHAQEKEISSLCQKIFECKLLMSEQNTQVKVVINWDNQTN